MEGIKNKYTNDYERGLMKGLTLAEKSEAVISTITGFSK